jgi:mono/diheme cytochrome c family protein
MNAQVVVTLVAIWGVVAAPAGAQAQINKAAAARGRTAYLRYCASCHGNEARGDGPRASSTSVPVPDLTTIAARSGGTFDYNRVLRSIMKGSESKGHQANAMPAWGRAFSGTDGMAAMVEAVRDLTHYLQSVQQP